MTAPSQPRTPDGRFRSYEAEEASGVVLTPPHPAVDRARRESEEFLEHNGLLDIVDHSVTAEEYGTVELHRMADPDIARGNCWAATNEVIELGASELGAEWVDELTISGRGQHVAILAGYPEGCAVVDFTIRQFDAGLAFPWTGTVDDWKKTVEAATGTSWEFEDDED
ncbi:hypothetical protein [Arthrobacter caoxuetaonis]|uniref:Uncharacterized protein n=1 Tax=Arthrobacter caoxuetaonis TaxID=2886935 RepID=A0A9X1MHY1_9MICC|nr:hypothetical protein [Arthrobacter caoxuetaonis]MCC3299657.1 hypothetical protein [Arthrobacter caoxuetaonis]USQ59001.1 hypothetical protein NF551_18010 [Arthrobacter caoxuetaonis]